MKVLNIFAIILAWLLSIAMVIMLIAAPLMLSALSLLDAENIAELLGESLMRGNAPSAAQPQQEYTFQKLSAEYTTAPENNAAAESFFDGLNLESIQDIVGEEIDESVLNKVLESDLVGELVDTYVGDVTNAITGKPGQNQFTAEKLVDVVTENVDEIVEIVEESGVTLTDEQKIQIKAEIQKAVKENAQQIVEALPAPEEIKDTLVGENKDLEFVFEILAAKNQIKGVIVGAIVLLSLLVFGLRYPGFRGLRWLASNLFIAGGFNVVICLALGVGSTAALGAKLGMDAVGGSSVAGIISALVSQLTTGVIIRTVIIVVAAIVLLAGYILLKIFVRKKRVCVVEVPATTTTPVECVAAPVDTVLPVAEMPDAESVPADNENL